MADSAIEVTGKNVDEAIAEGLAQLGLPENEVDVEIISRGSRGIFGLGSEPARVRLTPRREGMAAPPVAPAAPAPQPTPTPEPAPPAPAPAPAARTPHIADLEGESDREDESPAGEAAAEAVSDAELEAMAVEMLSKMVELMGFDAQVVAAWREADQPEGERYLTLDIEGSDLSPLIGRRGETLASIQYLLRLMVNQRIKSWKNITVDVDHYKERSVVQLTQLAHRMADQVAESGRAVSLEPMPASERRIVHLALRDHEAVYTQSSGEGDRRKVHIVAKT